MSPAPPPKISRKASKTNCPVDGILESSIFSIAPMVINIFGLIGKPGENPIAPKSHIMKFFKSVSVMSCHDTGSRGSSGASFGFPKIGISVEPATSVPFGIMLAAVNLAKFPILFSASEFAGTAKLPVIFVARLTSILLKLSSLNNGQISSLK